MPEGGPAEQQEQRENRKLGGAGALLAAVTVVPGQDEDDRQTDQSREQRHLADCGGPLEGVADVLQALEESPASSDVDQSPLHHLAAAQPRPGALGSTLCRRVGHSTAPMAPECSGIRSGCGCERGGGELRLSSPPDAAAVWLSAAAVWKRSRGERDHRIREAQPRRGGRRGSASRRAGNLETWDPAARSRTPRLPGFQIFSSPPRPATSAGATGGRGSAGGGRQPGELETWNAGNLRGAGRRIDAGPPLPASGRVGRTRAAAMASPWPGRAHPMVGLRCAFAWIAPGAPGSPLA